METDTSGTVVQWGGGVSYLVLKPGRKQFLQKQTEEIIKENKNRFRGNSHSTDISVAEF